MDVDPEAMRAYGVTLEQVFEAVRMSNADVGARTIEINRVEYVVRGVGFVTEPRGSRSDGRGHARATCRCACETWPRCLGPALRRGALDKEAPKRWAAWSSCATARIPLAVIERVKEKIERDRAGSARARTLPTARVSQVTVVPFYDRTGLIHETLGTLQHALACEILVTIIVVLVMVRHLRSFAAHPGLLPLAVLLCFIAMKVPGRRRQHRGPDGHRHRHRHHGGHGDRAD